MIQLQYQAVVEVVQLIDLLEKACIRFVHFSKENELRSRVFSEKMGLESGWNCHISLKGSENMKPKTVTCHVSSPQEFCRADILQGMYLHVLYTRNIIHWHIFQVQITIPFAEVISHRPFQTN